MHQVRDCFFGNSFCPMLKARYRNWPAPGRATSPQRAEKNPRAERGLCVWVSLFLLHISIFWKSLDMVISFALATFMLKTGPPCVRGWVRETALPNYKGERNAACGGKQPLITAYKYKLILPISWQAEKAALGAGASPSRGTRRVFIIHGVRYVEFFLPKREEVDSQQAARAAQPPPALPHAAARKKTSMEKNKSDFAAVMCSSSSRGQAWTGPYAGQMTYPQAVGFLFSSHQSYHILFINSITEHQSVTEHQP